ncbi:hypothetical protein [Moritella sp. Urea-trap-13]|uniref:hypothetical protein n=1 Tax=Moritella sp. Urea-trap-13 TaxID=2058327 RepID=UPI000C3484D2|nr:hypothetical protein [Moritella sp. Urea-trap-13]PKH05236.1 hypothetical protein CXF93_18255 [Moritella sp. Urea-trap-13]
MRFLPLIIFICLLNQGCSNNSNLPMNQPSSNIQNFAPASIEDATADQPISVDDLDKKENKTETKDEVLEEPKLNDADGAIRNMSDTSDFMPEAKSYWM